jgi:hypothetical protein
MFRVPNFMLTFWFLFGVISIFLMKILACRAERRVDTSKLILYHDKHLFICCSSLLIVLRANS